MGMVWHRHGKKHRYRRIDGCTPLEDTIIKILLNTRHENVQLMAGKLSEIIDTTAPAGNFEEHYHNEVALK